MTKFYLPGIRNSAFANAINSTLSYIHSLQWSGACHAVSSVLYVVFSELGYGTKLCIGECKAPNTKVFDHSWITIEGKIVDLAISKPLDPNMYISGPVVLDIDIETGENHRIHYGVSFVGLSMEAANVYKRSFVEYMDGYPDRLNGLWDVVNDILPKPTDIGVLREKYRDTKRIFVTEEKYH